MEETKQVIKVSKLDYATLNRYNKISNKVIKVYINKVLDGGIIEIAYNGSYCWLEPYEYIVLKDNKINRILYGI